jgi:hypothetical protein
MKILEKNGLLYYKLIHDEPTRWNSTFNMIERLLRQNKYIEICLINEGNNNMILKADDINILYNLIDLLKVFYDAN